MGNMDKGGEQKTTAGFESGATLREDLSKYQNAGEWSLDKSDYEKLIRLAKKEPSAMFKEAKVTAEQNSSLMERVYYLGQGLENKLRGENDPRVRLFVLLSSKGVLGKDYPGRLDNERKIFAEALRVAGDTQSRDVFLAANADIA